jgi:signal transduction histidine kinase
MQQEIRAFSFLAHPPSLTRTSLAIALEDLVNGFKARTGLEIEVDIASGGEVSGSVEAAIYRVSQEALANIHRHANAKRATFRLIARDRYLHLVIRDDGRGFASDPLNPRRMGVGVMGMEERVRELGGRLTIRDSDLGTDLTVTFPRQKRMVFVPAIGAR